MVRFFNDLRQTFGVEPGWLRHAVPIIGIADESRVAVLKEIQLPGRALDVGELRRIGVQKHLKPLPTHHDEPKVADQFLVMLLAYAEEIHHLPVEIVQDLTLEWLLLEKTLGPPRNRFAELLGSRKE